jgi:hypothetical protein
VEAPAADQQAVDAYLEERKDRKRGGRGGVQARLDELTRRTHLAEAKASVLSRAPRAEDFSDFNEYQAASTLWAIEEKARGGVAVTVETKPAPVAAPPPSEAPARAHLQVRKQEFDTFLEKGKRFVAGHPDFHEVMGQAAARGLSLSEAGRIAITSQAVPEVAYWLARPENDATARSIMQMDDFGQVVAISRIAERLAVKPADFISNAPAPGIRLTNGNTRSTLPISELETDDYIRQRAQEKRAARGRR